MNVSELLSFREKSPLIIAVDVEPAIGINELLERARNYVAGVKFGLPYILKNGLDTIRSIISRFRNDYFFIADIKLADIGFVGSLMIDLVKKMGFDAFIAHGFIGLRNALDKIKEKADALDLFLFVVAAMSHPGAEEILNKSTREIIVRTREINVRGYVAPATMPRYIQLIREMSGDSIIISPGVGAQGAEVGSAIANGASFEIIGRKITLSRTPIEEIRDVISIYRSKGMIRDA